MVQAHEDMHASNIATVVRRNFNGAFEKISALERLDVGTYPCALDAISALYWQTPWEYLDAAYSAPVDKLISEFDTDVKSDSVRAQIFADFLTWGKSKGWK
jgi:hypothetical protein